MMHFSRMSRSFFSQRSPQIANENHDACSLRRVKSSDSGNPGTKRSRRAPDGVRFAKWMHTEIGRVFALWHGLKNGHWEPGDPGLKAGSYSCSHEYMSYHIAASGGEDVAGQTNSVLKHLDRLFAFFGREGVAPTSDSGEQGIYPAGISRRFYFGNQS